MKQHLLLLRRRIKWSGRGLASNKYVYPAFTRLKRVELFWNYLYSVNNVYTVSTSTDTQFHGRFVEQTAVQRGLFSQSGSYAPFDTVNNREAANVHKQLLFKELFHRFWSNLALAYIKHGTKDYILIHTHTHTHIYIYIYSGQSFWLQIEVPGSIPGATRFSE
jgi:hypothetical protein